MSDHSEATAALDEVENLLEAARAEKDPAQRLGKILLVKECATQAVKFAAPRLSGVGRLREQGREPGQPAAPR